MALAYSKWIPGEHAPNGPITQLVNLRIRANGAILPWRRDPLDAFSFHLIIPPKTEGLEVDFDYVSPPASFGVGFGKSPDVTPNLLALMFTEVLLYPSDRSAQDVVVSANVRLPDGWSFDSALPVHGRDGSVVSFDPVSLTTLADSPLLAGRFFRQIQLTPEPGSTRLSIAADRPPDLSAGKELIGSLRRVVAEAHAVFGPEHYRHYAWQLALSGALSHDGTEHAQSADIRQPADLFTNPDQVIQWRLFPHEYVHSWNGKYRRPAGLDTRNFQQPMDDSLLWMYEGLTRYYGDLVLSARSGLATKDQSHDYLAYVAAQMAVNRPGRDWRPLADTAAAVPAFTDAPNGWTAVRRGSDYYNEMLLIWLEADMAIRRESGGGASLDDFCRQFFAGDERAPTVRRYTRADIVAALRAIAPLNWDDFLTTWIDEVAPAPPLAGLEASGWRLRFDDNPNPFLSSVERLSSVYNLSFSLGAWVGADGVVRDILPGSPAYAAGLGLGMRIVAIDSKRWTIDAARSAIAAAERREAPITLEVNAGGAMQTLRVNYHAGPRYPHLTRDASQPDGLDAILAPLAAQTSSQTPSGGS